MQTLTTWPTQLQMLIVSSMLRKAKDFAEQQLNQWLYFLDLFLKTHAFSTILLAISASVYHRKTSLLKMKSLTTSPTLKQQTEKKLFLL